MSENQGSSELPRPQITMPPSHGRHSLIVTLVAAGIVAAFVAAILSLGVQAYQRDLIRVNTFPQQGKVAVSSEEPLQVYYPAPYTSPPNLTFTVVSISGQAGDSNSWVEIVEQKPDYFKVRKVAKAVPSCEISWKADGVPKN